MARILGRAGAVVVENVVRFEVRVSFCDYRVEKMGITSCCIQPFGYGEKYACIS